MFLPPENLFFSYEIQVIKLMGNAGKFKKLATYRDGSVVSLVGKSGQFGLFKDLILAIYLFPFKVDMWKFM